MIMDLVKSMVGKAVKIDRPSRSISLRNEPLAKALSGLAARLAPKAQARIAAQPGGFFVSARVGEKEVSALLALGAVSFKDARIELVLGTPEGLTVDGRRVAGLFGRLLARMFGGVWEGEEVLGLPASAKWDGAQALLAFDLTKGSPSDDDLRTLKASAKASEADGWTTLVLDQEAALDRLGPVLLRMAGDALMGRLNG